MSSGIYHVANIWGWQMRSRGLGTVVPVALGLLVTAALAGWAAPAEAAATCAARVVGDVNGDGHAEAVVGEPFNANGAGAVHVFYGRSDGLVADRAGTALDDQYFTQ